MNSKSTPKTTVQFLQSLWNRLETVPELTAVSKKLKNNPEQSADIYTMYQQVIIAIKALRPDDISAILSASKRLEEMGGKTGSASNVSAADLHGALRSIKLNDFIRLVKNSANPNAPYTKAAVTALTEKLQGGHKMKQSGKTPSDDDAESKKVIWGHTQIAGEDALMHFSIAHYLGQYFALALVERGLKIASQKDFLVNAMADVLILDGMEEKRFAEGYSLWRKPKEEGGMGWITGDRLNSYL